MSQYPFKTREYGPNAKGTTLTWQDLDEWRQHKQVTPFSGTSVLLDKSHRALWFSKQIIPAIRREDALRQQLAYSPVYRHVGVYGFSYQMLQTFTRIPEGRYEQLEGLEQLRLLENGYEIHVVEVASNQGFESIGVDTIEDANWVETKLPHVQVIA